MVILFDRFNLSDDIYDLIFSTKQQVIVAKALVRYFKENKGTINKSQMSQFASALHAGGLRTTVDEPSIRGHEVKLTYNKRQFYDRILTPLKTMGMIDYDMYRKVYTLSDKFYQDIVKIGQMWLDELKKPVDTQGTVITEGNE